MDASGYLLNHAERTLPTVELSEDEASVMLSGELEVQNTHLALIPVGGEEILAYEFACRYGDEQYLVYIDAVTGDEVQVLVVKSSLGGTYLK
jgi:germination protein YpeB